MLCQVQQQRKKTSVMIKWIETGDKDYPRVPLKLTMLGFKKVGGELGLSDVELIAEITPGLDVNYNLIRLLWTAIDYGQTQSRTVVFKNDEVFAEWAWLSLKSVTIDDIEGLSDAEMEEFYSKIPFIKILQSVIEDLESYFEQLTKKQRKNVASPQQENTIAVEDH